LIQETAMLPGTNEELAGKIPIGRLGKPEEIAETVKWMVTVGYVTNKVSEPVREERGPERRSVRIGLTGDRSLLLMAACTFNRHGGT
jgi:hypothetical protein